MKVILTTDRVGVLLCQREGDEIDLPGEEALRLIRLGQAIAVSSTTECAAIASPPENAAIQFKPNKKKRKHHHAS